MTTPVSITPRRWLRTCSGFTLTEIMIASSIALVAVSMATTVFIWGMEQSTTCSRIAWSEIEAMRSSETISGFLRNAATITGFDSTNGNWIQVKFPDGSTGKLVYSNAIAQLRDGQMYLECTNDTQKLIVRGLTATMDSQGFNLPIFSRIGSNAVRVAYRLSEPTAQGLRAADDADYAASMTFTIYLRNSSSTPP